MPGQAITKDTPLEAIPTPDELKPIFEPIKLGRFELKNRAVYAPLTRCRAIGTVPIPEAAQYYSERTVDGQLILTEATGVSECSYGYPCTPGIHSEEQQKAWKPVVEAVKAKGGIFFAQIWHTGRASVPAYHNGELPVSSSAVAAPGGAYHPETFEEVAYTAPRALDTEEVPGFVEFFRDAARKSIDTGFDGVEIHATNGYLIAQFLQDGVNKRTDAYGGSVEKRCKFCLDIVAAVVKEIGADRVGIRLGPYADFLGANDSEPVALFSYLIEQLNEFNLAYMHFIEPRVRGNDDKAPEDVTDTIEPFLKACKTVRITAGGYIDHDGGNHAHGANDIKTGHTDMVCYGRWALANPDFLKRMKLDAPLNKYDRGTFYVPGLKGYTDYPHLEDTEHADKYYTAAK